MSQGAPGKEDKVLLAEAALKQSEEAVVVAKKDFETVTARVLAEVKRFKKDKADDMKKTVMDYIQLQIDYNKRMEEIWEVSFIACQHRNYPILLVLRK